jgi:divalent metal cation (Fe/Co/Zn/Cd) transporter
MSNTQNPMNETQKLNTTQKPAAAMPAINETEHRLLRRAQILAVITIVYNVVEGVVSILFGMSDETLALFGFGVDSFVEVISGIGILHMIVRMRRSAVSERDGFERTALRITGTAFYLLAAGLLAGATLTIVTGAKPETTVMGIVIAALSILTMRLLLNAKLHVGEALNSEAIIADANCTRTCYYLSMILLASSLLYEIVGIGWLDALGTLGIAWFAFREGRESFEKARSGVLSCGCGDHCASE